MARGVVMMTLKTLNLPNEGAAPRKAVAGAASAAKARAMTERRLICEEGVEEQEALSMHKLAVEREVVHQSMGCYNTTKRCRNQISTNQNPKIRGRSNFIQMTFQVETCIITSFEVHEKPNRRTIHVAVNL